MEAKSAKQGRYKAKGRGAVAEEREACTDGYAHVPVEESRRPCGDRWGRVYAQSGANLRRASLGTLGLGAAPPPEAS